MNLNANIYSLDLPSHNKSDEFPKLSLRLYVNILKNFVDLLSLKKIILAGHSLGGAVIQSYYFTYPSDISALVLIGTGCRLRVLPSILDSVKNDFQMFIADMNEELKKEFLKTTPNVVYNDFKICDEFDTLDKTDSIDIPCLILVGKDDIMTPVKYSEFFHKKIKDSKLVIIEDAGHMAMIEQPKEMNKAIENFIENHFPS